MSLTCNWNQLLRKASINVTLTATARRHGYVFTVRGLTVHDSTGLLKTYRILKVNSNSFGLNHEKVYRDVEYVKFLLRA